jgi:uncharacterized Zn finger protein (UPF0148 family)
MSTIKCPHCGNDDRKMIEILPDGRLFCGVCAKKFEVKNDPSDD